MRLVDHKYISRCDHTVTTRHKWLKQGNGAVPRACAEGLLNHFPLPTLVVLTGGQGLLNHPVVVCICDLLHIFALFSGFNLISGNSFRASSSTLDI
jgi:hypothetical protein